VAVRGLVPPIAFPLDHLEQMATDPVDVMSKHCRSSAPASRGDEWTDARFSDKGRLYRRNQGGYHVGLEDRDHESQFTVKSTLIGGIALFTCHGLLLSSDVA
jgi:hypothetical protein